MTARNTFGGGDCRGRSLTRARPRGLWGGCERWASTRRLVLEILDPEPWSNSGWDGVYADAHPVRDYCQQACTTTEGKSHVETIAEFRSPGRARGPRAASPAVAARGGPGRGLQAGPRRDAGRAAGRRRLPGLAARGPDRRRPARPGRTAA